MIKNDGFNEQCITSGQMNFINSSRHIWRIITTWNMAYITSRYLGVVGTEEVLFSRFYNALSDYGGMSGLVFDERFAEDFSWLLSEYAISLQDLVTAQLNGDLEQIDRDLERLNNNAEERAKLLAEANPFWDETKWREMFQNYLGYTIRMSNSFATEDYSREVEIYDGIIALTEQIADYYTVGIFNFLTFDPLCTECLECKELSQEQRTELPNELRCITRDQLEAIYPLRMFLYEMVEWIRAYIISRYAGLGNDDILLERINEAVSGFGQTMAYIFGVSASEELVKLFQTHIYLITSMISAQIEGNVEAANEAARLLYENANQISSLLSSLNPFWEEMELRNSLFIYIQDTIRESTAFLTGEYDRNIDIFSQLLLRAATIGRDQLALGLYRYLAQ